MYLALPVSLPQCYVHRAQAEEEPVACSAVREVPLVGPEVFGMRRKLHGALGPVDFVGDDDS